jgi:outer membrane lipoprotein carrier protein
MAVLFFLINQGAFAESGAEKKASSEWLSTIQKRYQQLQTVQAKFSQLIVSPRFGADKSSGSVYFKLPGQMHWEYLKPKPKQIVSNGQKSWMSDPEDKQILLTDAITDIHALSFLWGRGNLVELFKVQLINEATSSVVLTLLPLKSMPGVEKIKLTYDRKQMIVSEVEIFDLLGNINTVSFREIKLNHGLGAQLFHYSVPKGFTVIDSAEYLKRR